MTEKQIEILKNLRASWIAMVEECSTAGSEDFVEKMSEDYPFEMSFDEINLVSWIDNMLDKA